MEDTQAGSRMGIVSGRAGPGAGREGRDSSEEESAEAGHLGGCGAATG